MRASTPVVKNGEEWKMVRVACLDSGTTRLLIVSPRTPDIKLNEWLAANAEMVATELTDYGGILFRGFEVGSVSKFDAIVCAMTADRMEYVERSTPRRSLSVGVYTSTEYPADQEIPLHNENAYSTSWPRRLWFWCSYPAQRGGETLLCDSRAVFRLLDEHIKRQFQIKRVLYVRNYGTGADLPWQTVFQTKHRAAAEKYMRSADLTYEWLDDDRLRTSQVRPAIVQHPITGVPLWFNQAHLFHVSCLGREMARAIQSVFGRDELPRNAYFGDGSEIPEEWLERIREVYRMASVKVDWQSDDILILDNMTMAHGRLSYEGPRKIAVAMTDKGTA
jgi:alpha-ketoglutarate-dependent taurine dioxygenase